MSMKAMTTLPPLSRSGSWRTISSAASRLLRVTVCSRLPPAPVNLPVLTSTTVIASVRSMTRYPPDGSHTLRSSALVICSSIRNSANTSATPAYPRHQLRGHMLDVTLDGVPCPVALNNQLAEVLGEQIPDHLHQQIRLL